MNQHHPTARRRGLAPAVLLAAAATGGVLVATAPAASAAGTVPGAPRSLTATAKDAAVALAWQAPSSTGSSAITGYTATCSATGQTTRTSAVGGSTLAATVTGLTNGAPYTCSVSATNAAGTGAASSAVSATPKGAPLAPSGVTNATGATKITVKWKAPKSDGGSAVTGYAARCAGTDGGATLSASAAATATSVAIAGLPANKTYRCTVTATNALGTSPAASALGWAAHVVTTSSASTATLHFPVTAGKKISAIANAPTFGPNGCAEYFDTDPAGNKLWDSCLFDDGNNYLLHAKPSATSGTATVTISAPAGITGTAELNAYVFSDVTGTVRADGSRTTYSLPYPGQSARLSFPGTAGQVVSLLYSASTIVSTGYTSLQDAAGREIAYTGEFSTSFLDAKALPATGTYTLVMDHGYGGGSATFALYTVPSNTGTITRGGAAVPISLTVPGQNATRTFTGTAGQTVTVSYTGSNISGGEIDLLDPSGSVLGYATVYNEPSYTGRISTRTLTTSGTYTILVNPSISYTGSLKLTLSA